MAIQKISYSALIPPLWIIGLFHGFSRKKKKIHYPNTPALNKTIL